ncbi:MAG: radical SAM family heme chaperone HemW [Lysobacteraceae bacterium]|nr:MAG: radical SAM family heme chaperone HemW [Xanthomonadaceae bacterium]
MLTLPPLSLYVHLPWCVRKCPYCDFNSHEYRDRDGRGAAPPFEAYVDALIADLEFDLPLVWGRTVHSVFFGGGTPSLFPPEAIDRLLQAASGRVRFAPTCEITLETNPGAAEHGRFEDYRRAGVNRLSFGIQSFDDECLRRLGRIHDSAQADAAVKRAQDAGFDDVNLDLMYALPGQTVAMAEHDLARAFALRPSHLSHYQLTLEPNTVFAARPPQDLPDDDTAWQIQEHAQALLTQAGYAQYEISAYARPGRQCAHNLNYWRFGDYLGLGAGAHGKISLPDGDDGQAGPGRILRRWKLKHPTAYLVHAGTAAAIGGDEAIAPEQRPFEFMLNALRLHEGFPIERFEARTGLPRRVIAEPVARAKTQGWLVEAEGHIRPTDTGLRFANDAISLFLGESGSD